MALAAGCSSAPTPPPEPTAMEAAAGGAPQETPSNEVAASKPAGTSRHSLRGIGCSVKNDCEAGLSCIQGVCQPSSFGLAPSAKECVQIDCTTTADCCGNLPPGVTDECRRRASTCLQTLPGCVQKQCTRSGECAGGGVCVGHCAITSGECRGNVDCLANKCVEGKCSLNFTSCSSDAECAANTCAGGSCACENPNYQPTHPICSDERCDGICLWACERSRCVLPTTCADRDDCFGSRPLCVDGSCVECSDSADCSFGKLCLEGSCETACQNDHQCGLFEACQQGECIYVGCRSDRECTLIPDVRSVGLAPGVDARLLRCHTQDGIGRCVVPCQTDSQCRATEVCSGGLCQYIGCETNEECSTILNVHEQVTTDEHPWIPAVECRSPAE